MITFFQRGGEDDVAIIFGRRTHELRHDQADRTRPNAPLEEHVLSITDIGIITVAVQDPEFHQRFIDRYLAIYKRE